MGDLNLQQINWKSLSTDIYNLDDIKNTFIECVRDNFLFQHIMEPTRQRSSDTPSTLDRIFINEENMIHEVDINSPPGNSGHAIILFKLKCYTDREEPTVKSFHHKGDYINMRELLKYVYWEEKFKKYRLNVVENWKCFKNKFFEVENLCTPQKWCLSKANSPKSYQYPLMKKKT